MSALELGIVVLGVLVAIGLVGEYGPRWIVAMREAERARLGRVDDLYPASVVHKGSDGDC